MINAGVCPHCKQKPSFGMKLESIKLKMSGAEYFGVNYVCPNIKCNAILASSFDPLALMKETISQTVKSLKK